MSAYLYGRMVRQSIDDEKRIALLSDEDKKKEKPQDKLSNAVAALIPADILTLHALVVSLTTTTDDKGATTITHSEFLQAMLVVLLGVTAVAYLIGRWPLDDWKRADVVKLLIPVLAFVAWTGLIGTSALTPWIAALARAGLTIPQYVLVVAAGVVGVILITVNDRVSPKKNA